MTTKTLRTIIASGSNAAGGTMPGTALDLRTAYGGLLTVKITNGATGPTIPTSAYIYVSGDNTNWKLFRQLTATAVALAVADWADIEIPWAVMYLRVDIKDNTGQAITGECFLMEATTLPF